MKQITWICDRCGAVCTDQPCSILELKAGELTKQFAEPWIDLCGPCSERFIDWLRSGRQANRDGPGEALADLAVASMAMS